MPAKDHRRKESVTSITSASSSKAAGPSKAHKPSASGDRRSRESTSNGSFRRQRKSPIFTSSDEEGDGRLGLGESHGFFGVLVPLSGGGKSTSPFGYSG